MKLKIYLKEAINEYEKIKGGIADNEDSSKFDQQQLVKGMNVEFEHTSDVKVAMEIAMDHLSEDPDYYKKLAKIEKK
jgi:hypothetical protein